MRKLYVVSSSLNAVVFYSLRVEKLLCLKTKTLKDVLRIIPHKRHEVLLPINHKNYNFREKKFFSRKFSILVLASSLRMGVLIEVNKT